MHVAAEDAAAAARGRRGPLRPEPVELKRLLADSAEAWRPAVERRGGRVWFDWKADGMSAQADRRRLAQAFGNLLANAVEHGGGEVVVRGRPSPDGLRIEVEDAGGAGTLHGALAAAAAACGSRRGRSTEQVAGSRSFDRAGGGRVAVAELPAERTR